MEAPGPKNSAITLSRFFLWLGILSIILPAMVLTGGPLTYAGPFGFFVWGFYHPVIYAPIVILFFIVAYVMDRKSKSGEGMGQIPYRPSIAIMITGVLLLLYLGPGILSGLSTGSLFAPDKILLLIILAGLIALIIYGSISRQKR